MRKMLPLATFMLALALAATPVAEAQDDAEAAWAYLFSGQAALLTVEAGPNAVIFTVHDITLSGQYAADARQAIDGFQGVGDGDGQLTESEVVGAEALIQSTVNSMLPSEFDFQMITIDGKTAYAQDRPAVEMMALDIKGAGGDVSSTDPIKTDVKVKLRFDTVDQSLSSHTFRFENLYGDLSGLAPNELPPAEIRVSGYSSWDIVGTSIEPVDFQDRLDSDTMTFETADIAYFDDEGKGLQFAIKGDPDVKIDETNKGSPGVAPFALIGLVGALLVALRRRG